MTKSSEIPAPSVIPLAIATPVEKVQEVVDSRTLFQGRREIWIEHEGERYRLRITRRGKLILQK